MLQILTMVEQMDLRKEISKWMTMPSRHAGLGDAITAELMIGFWFGIGVFLAVGVVESLNYCAATAPKHPNTIIQTFHYPNS